MLVPDSGIIAVEIIGNGGGDEHSERHPAQPQRPVQDRLREYAADHHRDGRDSGAGEDIRKGQRAPGRSLGGPSGCGDVHPSYQYCPGMEVNRTPRATPSRWCKMTRNQSLRIAFSSEVDTRLA